MRAIVFVVVGLFSIHATADDLKIPLRPVTSVSIGRHAILPMPPGVKTAVVADPRIASARVLSDSEVPLAGNNRGRTTLTIRATGGETVYDVSVEPAPPLAQARPAETIALGVGYQKS